MHPFVNANICSKTSIGEIFRIVNRNLSKSVQYNGLQKCGGFSRQTIHPHKGMIGRFQPGISLSFQR